MKARKKERKKILVLRKEKWKNKKKEICENYSEKKKERKKERKKIIVLKEEKWKNKKKEI